MNFNKYVCDTCNFNTIYKNQLAKHKLTKKHLFNMQNPNISRKTFTCEKCNIIYNSNTSLWRHKKQCITAETTIVVNNVVNNENTAITSLISKIDNLENMIIELKSTQSNTIAISDANNECNNNNNTDNSTNFNINLFLNEKCGKAPNFIDTLKSLKIDNNYNDNVLNNGYVNTVCDIIKTQLSALPITERPIHCIKDENIQQNILHIRHDNQWETETELQWTNSIHNDWHSDYNSEDEPDETDKQIIFQCLKQIEENIINQLRQKYGFYDGRNKNEIEYALNKIKVVKCLLQYVKMEKIELYKIIEKYTEEVAITSTK